MRAGLQAICECGAAEGVVRVGAGNYGGKLGKFQYHLARASRVSALVFTLKEEPPQRCDLSPLSPDRLAASSAPIERIEIQTTKRRLCVGDIFAVTPGDPVEVRFEGGSERFDNVGMGMMRGRIAITGDLGQQAGRGHERRRNRRDRKCRSPGRVGNARRTAGDRRQCRRPPRRTAPRRDERHAAAASSASGATPASGQATACAAV